MRMPPPLHVSIAALLLAGACQSKQETVSRDSAAGMMDSGMMKGMPGMRGDSMMGGMMGGTMMQMEAHMRMMDTASAATMQSMIPMHRQMVANMLSGMNDEMRRMNMSPSAQWTATVDSLRQDLIRMPEMSATELATLMPAHRARMMRLMQMHRTMMGRGDGTRSRGVPPVRRDSESRVLDESAPSRARARWRGRRRGGGCERGGPLTESPDRAAAITAATS